MNKNRYFGLFATTFSVSALTFGGGYVIVPLLKKKFVDEKGWLEEKEMLDITAIATSAPGVMAINTSILIGYRVGGVGGALVSMLGAALPPLIIMSIVGGLYDSFIDNTYVASALKGMQATVAALLADAVFSLSGNIVGGKDVMGTVIMVVVFAAAFFLNVNVVVLILSCAAIGLVRSFGNKKK
ncbi:MAG: chromate transporter [Clostridiales bacterium]|jgi:chromate transporter|nr:chromate transporter [Clostridiales bacterium]